IRILIFDQDHIQTSISIHVDDCGPAQLAKSRRERMRLPQLSGERARARSGKPVGTADQLVPAVSIQVARSGSLGTQSGLDRLLLPRLLWVRRDLVGKQSWVIAIHGIGDQFVLTVAI